MTLSAVIPTHNRGGLVCRAIDSALAQDHPPDEIVVVDDGSTDDTRERLARYAGRVRYVAQANAGGAAARNRGVEAATGDWIAFLDSDDIWLEGHLRRMRAAIEATEGRARFYFADMLRAGESGDDSHWRMSGFSIEGPHQLVPRAADWAMMPRQPMMLQASVFRRRDYLACGGLRRELIRRHDTHIFLRMGLSGPACAVSGDGTRLTADDAAGRLTLVHDGGGEVYWRSTVLLYRDILSRPSGLRARDRAELRRRLSAAHLRLAAMSWEAGRRRGAGSHLLGALRRDPSLVAARTAGRLRGTARPPTAAGAGRGSAA